MKKLLMAVWLTIYSAMATSPITYRHWEKLLKHQISLGETPEQLLQWIKDHPPTADQN